MENQELNLWLIKRLQTESCLRAEEQRLDNVRKEYSSERTKYQAARETFKSTKLRLLSEKDPGQNPAVKFEADKASTKKLKDDKSRLDEINQRLANVEGKLKKQSVLVLQNKKKLEVLEERINFIRGRKIAKRNFKEELEILDSKIQQMVLTNNKLNKAVSRGKEEFDEIKEEDKSLSEETLVYAGEERTFSLVENLQGQDTQMPFPRQERESHQRFRQEYQRDDSETNHAAPNREFYEKLSELNEISYRGEDYLSLRYQSKSGGAFEIEIKKDADQGLSIEIRPHSTRDTFSLNASKNEIVNNLREQGFKLNNVKIRDYANDSE